MIENSKVAIKIEYVREGLRRIIYGEIEKNKVKGPRTLEESFLLLLNDGKMAWVDKQAILSVSELEIKSVLYEKDESENESFAVKKELRIAS